DDPDIRMAQSMMDYIFRRLALDYLPFETRSSLGIYTTDERTRQLETGSYEPVATDSYDAIGEAPVVVAPAPVALVAPAAPATPTTHAAPASVHSSAELMDLLQGREADAPLCMNCGIKMRPAGSCHVCEGCGSTSGCS
ncbi:MAG TPA: vitamin B12-dependent ribonucleotide reductase, partial [Actinotalea sp.]|nr:vitamin B12-dependent ribonucleotide reductase [Actinotalea sp.]